MSNISFDEKRQDLLSSMRKSVKAYRNGAKMMKRRAESISVVFDAIVNNELPYEKSVARVVKDAQVSVTLLSFFLRSKNRGSVAQNMFSMCRLIMEGGGGEYLEDEIIHDCEDQDCKHQDDFYYLILSNYKATPAIEKLVQEWKEIGPRDGCDVHQDDRFCEIFTTLEEELAKDKFKIKTTFIDLI